MAGITIWDVAGGVCGTQTKAQKHVKDYWRCNGAQGSNASTTLLARVY